MNPIKIMAIVIFALSVVVCLSNAQVLVNPVASTIEAYNTSVAPIGVAAYGLSNISTASGPYEITTNEVFGYAEIRSMQAYNGSLGVNASPYGISLELNAMLNISSQGKEFTYFVQDTLDFNDSNDTYYWIDNIWNDTNPLSTLNSSSLTGLGIISPSSGVAGQNSTTFYSYAGNSTPYSLPSTYIPVMRVIYSSGGRPYLQFGYIQNGAAYFYDNVTFSANDSTAYFLVDPYNQTPSGISPANSTNFYDVEWVFGGEASGANTHFSSMNGLLWIGYLNNGTITPFPTVGVFGSDSTESASNLAVSQSGGYALITTGNPNYNDTITLSGVPAAIFSPPVPPVILYTTTVVQLPVGPPSSGGSLIIIGIIVIVIVWFIYSRSRPKSPTN